MESGSKQNILVTVGDGAVGSQMVARLHQTPPSRVSLVAGRHHRKAEEVAGKHGEGVEPVCPRHCDRGAVEAAVRLSHVVVMATEANTVGVAEACCRFGVPFVSVAASIAVMQAIKGLDGHARASSAPLVIEVGLAPGLMNLLARRLLRDASHARSLRYTLELDLVGGHGEEAIRWTLSQVRASRAEAITPPTIPCSGRSVIPVDFFDTDRLEKALGLQHVRSNLSIRPRWAVRALP